MSIRRLALVGLLAVYILLILTASDRVPGIYEYNVLSPVVEQKEDIVQGAEGQEAQGEDAEEQRKTALETMLQQLDERMQELDGVARAYGAMAYTPQTAMSDADGSSVTALLRAQWGAKLHPDGVLTEGRQLYLEELELGTPSAVIDEKLAIQLYRVGDPVGRKLSIGGIDFTVVGVVRHHRTAGDREEVSALVPLKALDKGGFQTKMLSIVMQPEAGSGAYAALSQAMEQWQGGGDFYSLSKELYRVRLPLRILLCTFGIMLVSITLKLAGRISRRLYDGGRQRLNSRYALQVMPELVARGLGIVGMYVVNVAAIALVLQALIAPVYIFPEWVPAILVEPGEIIATFWKLRAQETGLVALRSPSLLALQYQHRLMTLCCCAVFVLSLKPYYSWKQKLFAIG